MSDLLKSIEIVSDAEIALRRLMENALGEQRYGDVVAVAPLAEALTSLINKQRGSSDPASNGPKVAVAPRLIAPTNTYPHFRRDGDKLVKVGWTKKEGCEYEHRAPRDAIMKMGKAITTIAEPNTTFTMDALLPLRRDRTNDFPSYQAYLVLAWFRDLGLVSAKGKEGYVFKRGSLDPAKLAQCWEELPKRETTGDLHE